MEVQRPFPAKATLHIHYEDGVGQRTNRTIDVQQFGTGQNGNILIAHCRMRNATRTFRVDRIKYCVDEETGEVIGEVIAYLRKKYEISPECSSDILYEKQYDFLRVLLYVGKADGQLRAAEKVIIRETCRSLANDSRITDDMIDKLFSGIDIPSIHAFKMAVGRLAKNGQQSLPLLMRSSEEMVATQKTIHPSEADALEYMRKRFLLPT